MVKYNWILNDIFKCLKCGFTICEVISLTIKVIMRTLKREPHRKLTQTCHESAGGEGLLGGDWDGSLVTVF